MYRAVGPLLLAGQVKEVYPSHHSRALVGVTAAVDMGTVALTVTIATDTSGGGSGATLSITGDGAGGLVSVIPVAIGIGYVAADTITISQGNLQAAGFTGAVGDLVVTLIAGNIVSSIEDRGLRLTVLDGTITGESVFGRGSQDDKFPRREG